MLFLMYGNRQKDTILRLVKSNVDLYCTEEQEKLRHCYLKLVLFGRLCTVNRFSFHKLLGS